jgi:chromosome segregation ATPase
LQQEVDHPHNDNEAFNNERQQFENKIINLERELSEAKMALDQELNHPRLEDNERNEMLGKISWLENEAPYLRQCIDNERIAKENAENILRDKGYELDSLYRERDSLWGRINDLEGQLAEKNGLVNDLTWLQNEKNQLLEQLQNSTQNEALIKDLNERISVLEQQISELKPKAEEATHLKEQLDELLRFVERLRTGS